MGMRVGGEGQKGGRDLQRQIITRLAGVWLEDLRPDLPALQVVGSAGGGMFTDENKGLGSKGRSANQGDSPASWEVSGPWRSEGGGYGVDFFAS